MKRILPMILLLCCLCGCAAKNAELSGGELTPNHLDPVQISELPRKSLVPDKTLAAVQLSDGTWTYLLKDGEAAFQKTFLDAGDFSENLAAVQSETPYGEKLYGYIDSTGEYVTHLHPLFLSAGPFSDGAAVVSEEGDGYFYIDKTAGLAFTDRIIDYGENYFEEHINLFSYATGFQNGYALVGCLNPDSQKYEYYVISREGKAVFRISPELYDLTVYSVFNSAPDENGLCVVASHVKDAAVYGAVDLSGKFIFPLAFESLLPESDGLYRAKKNGRYGYLDSNGEVVIGFSFEDATCFSNGYAGAKCNGSWYVINKSGNPVFKQGFEEIRKFSESLAAVKKDGKWGFADQNGVLVIPAVFEETGDFHNGTSWFRNTEGLYGYLDNTGAVVIEAQYTKAKDFCMAEE